MTHSSSQLLGFRAGFEGGVHRESGGRSSLNGPGGSGVGEYLVYVICVSLDGVLLVLSSVLSLVSVSESLPVHVSVFDSASECF